MKTLLILLFAISFTSAFAQLPTSMGDKVDTKITSSKNDTVMVLYTVGYGTQAPKTAYFINGKFIKYALLISSNPEHIESISVIEKLIEIDDVKYEKQIHFVAKDNYFPKAISLVKLRDKYFPGSLKNLPVMFSIDGNIVYGDSETYEIDENNLFAITYDLPIAIGQMKLQHLKLTTRTEASNVDIKSSNIWIRKYGPVLRWHP